jgi:hypothetical protein
LLVQLLVEIAFIDLEAGDIQRFSECEVAVFACLLCCRAESFDPGRGFRPFLCVIRWFASNDGMLKRLHRWPADLESR